MAGTQRMRSPKVAIAIRGFAFFLSLIGILCLFTVSVHEAAAAEYRIVPVLTLMEEYNDNVFLTPTNRQEDYITHFRPAVTITYHSAFWNWDLDYVFDYSYYLKKTRTEDSLHRTDLRNRTVLIDNFLFFEGRDLYERVSTNAARDFTQESQFINQTDRDWITLNPYAVFRSGSAFTPIIGYKYDAAWYKEPTTVDTVDHMGYLEMVTPLTSNLTFTVGVRYTQDYNRGAVISGNFYLQNYYKTDYYAGPRYAYAERSYAYCALGESTIHFAGGQASHHFIWDAGIVHRYSTITLSFITKSDYVHDPFEILRRVDSFVTTLTRAATTRTSLTGSMAFYEYRNPALNNLEDDTYQLSGELRHTLVPGTTIIVETSNSRYTDYVLAETTYVYLWGVSLERVVKPDLTFTLGYSFAHSYSPDYYYANYDNNKVSVGLTQRF